MLANPFMSNYVETIWISIFFKWVFIPELLWMDRYRYQQENVDTDVGLHILSGIQTNGIS